MEKTLSAQQIAYLEQAYLNGSLSLETEIHKLVEAGFEKAIAEQLIREVIKKQREILFKQSVGKANNEEARKAAFMITLMISVIGPVFEINSLFWYAAAMGVAGCAGYFGYKDKPLAGIIAAAVLVLLFPLCYDFYFTGRTSYINIELLIPLLLSVLPAWLILWCISIWFYPAIEK